MNRRLASLDLIRGLAILAMVQAHIWEFYIGKPSGLGVYLFRWISNPLGGCAAPLFTLISGVSACLAVRSNLLRTEGQPGMDRLFFRRGTALFLLSTLVNFLAGPLLHVIEISLLNWGILQLIGACLCFVPIFVRLSGAGKITWVVVPALLAAWLAPGCSITAALFAGFAPPFPWASLFFGGMLLGEAYSRLLSSSDRRSWLRFTGIGLLFLFPVGWVLHLHYRSFTWQHLANPSLTALVVFSGCFIILVAGFGFLLDRREYHFPGSGALAGLGRHALTVYYLQLVGIVLSAMAVRALFGISLDLSWLWFLPMFVIALLILHWIVNVIWAKFDYLFSVEWLLAKAIKVEASSGLQRAKAS